MKKLLILATFAALSLCTAQAEVAPSHAAAIEKMFAVMKIDAQYEANLISSFESGIGISEDQIKALPQEQQDKFKSAMTKVQAKLMSTMGWSTMKADMINAYAQVYSEKEATDITELMGSPAGQVFVSKQATLLKEVMKMTQEKMKGLQPEITRIVQEEMTK
ncbi:DUF2059 domain-containing protein [Prosthecobacter sp.]|uniref:DUF2059 domain-containing protein n=1 Tax=Prosthecobacter sp. TaxID=1965333 RepID=UPI0037835102